MHVNGLLIDAENVLYDSTAWDRWLFKLLNRFGVVGSYLCHEKVWGLDYLPEVNCGAVDYWAALRRYLMSLGLTAGQAEEVIGAGRIRQERSLESKRLFPAARMGLLRLSSAMPIALVANTHETGGQIAASLRRSGISSNLVSILTSRDVGASLPDAGFIRAALKRICLAPQARIGLASKNEDILGQAARLGLATIGLTVRSDCPCNWKFDRFEQMAESLGHQQASGRMAA